MVMSDLDVSARDAPAREREPIRKRPGSYARANLQNYDEFSKSVFLGRAQGRCSTAYPAAGSILPMKRLTAMCWPAAGASSRFAASGATPVTITEETTACGGGRPGMDHHRIHRLPVMRNSKVVGIVSRADLLRALVQSLRKTTAISKRDEDLRARMTELEREFVASSH